MHTHIFNARWLEYAESALMTEMLLIEIYGYYLGN